MESTAGKILRLGKETAIYGLSTVVGRFLNFLIVPLYANTLSPEQNGAIANIYAYIAFAAVIYGIGMEQAFMRFYAHPEGGTAKQNFTVPFVVVGGSSLILSSLLFLRASTVAGWIGLDDGAAPFVRYASAILLFDALAIVPFAMLRLQQRAMTFATFKFMNIAINLCLNILLIVGFQWKAEGVFAANLAASVLTFFMIAVPAFVNLEGSWSPGLLGQFLRFGFPLIPAGLAGIALQVIDRPLVKALAGDAQLGIYQLNYRLGIIMMLVVGMFDYAWRPFFLRHAKEEGAPAMFAKVFTLLVLGLSFVFVMGTLFIGPVVRATFFGHQFFPSLYWPGLAIVPWILLAYVFTGLYTSFVVGLYIEKQTHYIPFISGAAAIVNVGANLFLIPRFGILGAAWATTGAYAFMAASMYVVSQRHYPISYEWKKIGWISIVACIVLMLDARVAGSAHGWNAVLLKSGCAVVFILALFLTRVVSMSELRTLFAASSETT